MLLSLLDGKLVVTSDFSVILTKDQEQQEELFGLLRRVYDGSLSYAYNNELGVVTQKARFDWIIAATQLIERQRTLDTELGNRFIDLRWGFPLNERRAIEKAMRNSNTGVLEQNQKILAGAMRDILDTTPPKLIGEFPDLIESDLGIIGAKLRTAVKRDPYTKDIETLTKPELATRIGQGLAKITTGLLMMGIKIEDTKPYLARVVLDAASELRGGIVKCWLDGITNQDAIAERVGIGRTVINRAIGEFKYIKWEERYLGIIKSWQKPRDNGGYKSGSPAQITETMIKAKGKLRLENNQERLNLESANVKI